MKRTYRVFIELIAGTFAAAMIVFVLALWAIFAKPFTSADFSGLIETSIEAVADNVKAYVPQSVLAWNNEAHAIALHTSGVELRTRDGVRVADIGEINLRLSVLNLFAGRFIPTELMARNITLHLHRDAQGRILLPTTPEVVSDATSTPSKTNISESVRGVLAELTHKNISHDLDLRDITIVVHDDVSSTDATLFVPSLKLVHRDKEMSAFVSVSENEGNAASPLKLAYRYSAADHAHHIDLTLDHFDPSLLFGAVFPSPWSQGMGLPLSGTASLSLNEDFKLLAAQVQLHGEDGNLNLPDLWEKSRHVKSFKADAHFNSASGMAGTAQVAIDFDGPHLSLKAKLDPLSMTDQGRQGLLDTGFEATIQLAGLPMDSFATVWPKPVVTNARAWMVENMHKGVFSQGLVTVHGRLASSDLNDVQLDTASGHVSASGGQVSYMNGMPPIEGVSAEAKLDLDHMEVRITSGGIGAMKVQPFTIQMTDFSKNIQMIDIPLKLMGPVPDVLRLLDEKPLGYAKAIGLDPSDTQGSMEGQLTLHFPLLNDLLLKDVDVKASASIKDFGAAHLVPGFALTKGNLALDLNKDGYSLKGPIDANGAGLQVAWQGRFGDETPSKPRNQAQISGVVNEQQLKSLGIDATPYLTGQVGLQLHYTANDKKVTQLAGDVDLKGAALDLAPLNWTKKPEDRGVISFSATMQKGKNIYIKLTNIDAPQLKAKGTVTLDAKDSHLLSIDLQPLIVGKTDVSLHMTPSLAPSGPMRVTLEGTVLDISGTEPNSAKAEKAKTLPEKKEKKATDYDLRLDKVLTGEGAFLTGLRARAVQDSVGWTLLDVHAMAQGSHPVDIALHDQDGKRVFSMVSDDFGLMLKGFGLTDALAGGKVKITGQSLPGDMHKISGRIRIGGFVVSNLPVLVRLVSAVSPFGFADLITGDASFSSMRGDFVWRGDDLDLQQVRMAGSAYGLNIGGHLDLETGVANLHGTLVPFSFINSILGSIPMLGSVITGGDGQGVLAASYSLTGPLNDPSVGVNPVSLLTPGFIRNLFFSESDTSSETETAPKPDTAAPPAEPKPETPKEPEAHPSNLGSSAAKGAK